MSKETAKKRINFQFGIKETTHEKRPEQLEQLKNLWKRHVAITNDLKIEATPEILSISVNVPSTRALDTIAETFIRNCREKGHNLHPSVNISFTCSYS